MCDLLLVCLLLGEPVRSMSFSPSCVLDKEVPSLGELWSGWLTSSISSGRSLSMIWVVVGWWSVDCGGTFLLLCGKCGVNYTTSLDFHVVDYNL